MNKFGAHDGVSFIYSNSAKIPPNNKIKKNRKIDISIIFTLLFFCIFINDFITNYF